MTIKQELENLKSRLFRIETIVWILAISNGIQLGTDNIPTLLNMISGGP